MEDRITEENGWHIVELPERFSSDRLQPNVCIPFRKVNIKYEPARDENITVVNR